MSQDLSPYNYRHSEDQFGSYDNDVKRRRTGTPPSEDALAMNFHNAPEVPQSQRPRQLKPHERFQPFILLASDAPYPQGLALLDALICQHVEIFQSFADEGPQSAQLGLRCVHCARAMQRHVDSCIIFPSSIETMDNSLRMTIERHFPKCEVLPDSVRESFDASRRASLNHDERQRSKLEDQALTYFLHEVCKNANVVNRQPLQTGIVEGNILEPMALSAFHEEPSNTLQYSNQNTPIPQPPSPYHSREDSAMILPTANHSDHRPSQQYPQPWSPYQTNTLRRYNNMPFIKTGQNIWECQYCLTQPIGYRAERYAWYAPSPPDEIFMDGHLRNCTGREPHYHGRQPNQQHHQYQATAHQHQSPSGMYNMQPSNCMYEHDSSQQQMQTNHGLSYQHPSYLSNRPSYNHQYRTQQSAGTHQVGQQSSHSWTYSTPTASAYKQHLFPSSSDPAHSHTPKRVLPTRRNSESVDVAIQLPKKRSLNFSTNSDKTSDLKEANDYLTKMEMKGNKSESEVVLVEDEDRRLITDYFYHVMKQLRICHFKENDRTTRGGKRDSILIGYGGLECIHCSGPPRPRKFFWSNVDRLSNSFSEIPSHLLKCKVCPESTKKALTTLKKFHPTQMTDKSRGSQKTFLRRVWRRIHGNDTNEAKENTTCPESLNLEVLPTDSIVSLGSDSPDKKLEAAITSCKSTKEAAKILASDVEIAGKRPCILLGISQDKHWGKPFQYLNTVRTFCTMNAHFLTVDHFMLLPPGLSDIDIFARQNLEVFCCATEAEAATYTNNGEKVCIGQVGLRCINCLQSSEQEDKYVTFPSSLDEIFSAVRAFNSKHLCSCSYLNKEQHQKYDSLIDSSSSSFGPIVREYYHNAAKALGLRDAPQGGIRATGHGGFQQAV